MPNANILTPELCPDAAPPQLMTGAALAGFEKYLVDESRHVGHAAALALPRSTAEVCGAVQAACEMDLPITVSGARTGIAGGAVPDDGMLISLERMSRICALRKSADGSFLVRCEANVALADLQRAVAGVSFPDSASWDAQSRSVLDEMKALRLFYPPDPTETSAAIGGTVACNASGAHTFRYGPTRGYVHAILVVLADARCLRLERGRHTADADGVFHIRRADDGVTTARVPLYAWPKTKNAAGYFAGRGMDLIDLFIGSEGTLGIITEVELRLVPAPETNCATVTFWPTESAALSFARMLRELREELAVGAIEYFDENALDLLRERRRELGAASGVPECLPQPPCSAIYLDIGTAAADLADVTRRLAELVTAAGAAPSDCWSGLERDERERLRVFRHALPETVNARIAETQRTHPDVTKLGTDMAVPDERLEELVQLYRTTLDRHGLEYVVFGHIGDNHLHVNILPRNPQEYAVGKQLYSEFAVKVVEMGGSPAAEHGIGKLKTAFLETMYGRDGIDQMMAVKRAFDPELRLGRGTLFEELEPEQ